MRPKVPGSPASGQVTARGVRTRAPLVKPPRALFEKNGYLDTNVVIVLRPGMTATEAGYKKPKGVIFVDELPKKVSGKIIKRDLRDCFSPPTNQ